MDTNSILNTVKEVLRDVLSKMSISYDSIETVEDSPVPRALITTKDSKILIGARGEHLFALNYVVKKIISTKYPKSEIKFTVDVNNYMGQTIEEIKNKALILAGRARSFKTGVEMDPASPYERMIVHALFENTPDIETESKGTGAGRRVVIKYKEEAAA